MPQLPNNTKTTPHRETLQAKIRSFVARWVLTPSDAASVLSRHAKRKTTLRQRYEETHARLRAARDAGYVAGVKVR